jgi:hypothetical protein
MNLVKSFVISAFFGFFAPRAAAYKVWLGTHKWEGAAADHLDQWDQAIAEIDGINYVLLDARTDRPAGEGANTNDWRTMIAPIDQSIPGMAEISRSQFQPAHSRTLAARMDNEFATAQSNGGYEIDIIMLYDEATPDGTVHKFSLADVQAVRAWLDSNGHADVTIVFRLTNNDQERLGLAQQSIVDGVLIEASATRWINGSFNIHTLLQDLWTDPSTRNKNIYFQIPRSESSNNQYVETRRALKKINELMGNDFMRSDQAIFIVCNYGDTFPTYPETASNDTLYVNSKSGTALSLIEQRSLFEGRTRQPTFADTDSATRLFAPTITLIANQVVPANTATSPLVFTIGDDQTAASALILNQSSSNINLVPLANIVFGGSGANRTVTVTPASGQSGSAVIGISLSDGTLATLEEFVVTVQPPGILTGTIYSDLVDSSPRRADGQLPGILSTTAADTTLYAGRGGSGGSVDRCIIFPFQLPSLGVSAAPFNSASFSFQLSSNDFSGLNCNLDLYALPNRLAATVFGEDYYSETNTSDPAAGTTRLQDNICVPTSLSGLYHSDTASNAALVNFLNAQYAGGANAGKFVFLRLNKDAPVGTSTRKYIVTSANGAFAANDLTNWPKIQFTAVEGNQVPVLNEIADRTLISGQTLQITARATDSNIPGQNLSFSLVSPPGGVSIHPTSGVLSWRPTIAQSPSIHALTIKVADSGTPSLSASRSFQVTVQKPAMPILTVSRGASGMADLSLTGDPGPDYEVEASGNLKDWVSIWTNRSAVPPFEINDSDASTHDKRFYRVMMGP